MTMQSTTATDDRRHHCDADEDKDYSTLLHRIRGTIDATTGPLFTTDATGLYDRFLAALPPNRRQHYECRSCRTFIERLGGLVEIDASGSIAPILGKWNIPAFFEPSVRAICETVKRARVTGVFLQGERDYWGTASNESKKSPTGAWRHMHFVPDESHVHKSSALLTSSQAMAEKDQYFGMLCRGLAEFTIDHVRQAHTLLTTGALYRSEKCIGVAKWLLELHETRAATKNNSAKENFVWRAVASAPPGFCHVRTTMIATLLEDIVAGKDFADIKRAFDSKMSPIQYQRPQAAPTDGQLAAAEKIVEKLASAGSLARRFARLEEVLPHAIWAPKAKAGETPSGSVFGHLKASKAPSAIDVPAQVITWAKLARTVLPDAESIEYQVPHSSGGFFAFVTAENADAPPILQWDSEGRRNPVSWYLYQSGSMASVWGLTAATFVEVTAIAMQPSGWNGGLAHQGDGAYFILRGARDMNHKRAGIGLFPEILRAEYREIRAAIEAFSRSRELGGADSATACGVAFQKSASCVKLVVRVTSKAARVLYTLDRWD